MGGRPDGDMAEGKQPQAPDAQLFGLLSDLLQQVESLSNQEEVELRAKIEALGLEVTKDPSKSAQNLDEIEIAKELDKLSSKLDDVDKMISSTIAADPEVQSLLSSTADVWMPVITASSDERRNFMSAFGDDNAEVKQDKESK
ncbi:OLC1v1001687C1 [Oldenlandia corymbosa var. corymbosa]|uniref:OLC1v1001687C1 n=1 Tax=Oldenlandia corymbosa var. corymbosa TaxID=529605 RepID=A0AAV1D6J9_OLDCO|nr:OLC1v1001687C1 [Oldenlandia corymbosa var. corymbosa]